MSRAPVIAIDGPSGSGKGTIARKLADALNWHLLDSGALYRIVAYSALEQGLPVTDEAALAACARGLEIVFTDGKVLVDGENVTLSIRKDEVSTAASQVSAHPAVRDALMEVQHGFRRAPGLVADGRDMGTVVFPDAPLKIYLDASVEERAQRRYRQLLEAGLGGSLRALRENIAQRDDRDKRRTVSPLVPATDAIQIDSTDISAEGVFNQVLELAQARGLASMPT